MLPAKSVTQREQRKWETRIEKMNLIETRNQVMKLIDIGSNY